MGIIVAFALGVVFCWLFLHPEKAKEIKDEIKEKIDQHKK